jgi:hypothetical protein
MGLGSRQGQPGHDRAGTLRTQRPLTACVGCSPAQVAGLAERVRPARLRVLVARVWPMATASTSSAHSPEPPRRSMTCAEGVGAASRVDPAGSSGRTTPPDTPDLTSMTLPPVALSRPLLHPTADEDRSSAGAPGSMLHGCPAIKLSAICGAPWVLPLPTPAAAGWRPSRSNLLTNG